MLQRIMADPRAADPRGGEPVRHARPGPRARLAQRPV